MTRDSPAIDKLVEADSAKQNQDDGKGGLSLRGVAFMTVFAVLTVLAVLETQWRAPCSPFAGPAKTTGQRGNLDGFEVLAVWAVMAVSVVTANPVKPNPPFPSS